MAPRVKRLPLRAFFCIHSDSAAKQIASATLATAVFKPDGFKEACTAFQEPPRSLGLCAWNGRLSLRSELFPLSSELDVLRYEGLRASTAGSRTIKVNTAATAMSAAMNTLLVAQPNHSTAAAPNIVPRVPPTK